MGIVANSKNIVDQLVLTGKYGADIVLSGRMRRVRPRLYKQ